MRIAAIPTRYANVQFRSRLEARWAAFFDCVGWSWQYEAIDLEGWIPDFSLDPAEDTPPLLIEVKPCQTLHELRQAARSGKIAWPAMESKVLVLGACVPMLGAPREWGGDVAGVLATSCEVAVLAWSYRLDRLELRRAYGRHGLVSGYSPEDDSLLPPHDGGVVDAWREAGSRVQYCSPRHRRETTEIRIVPEDLENLDT